MRYLRQNTAEYVIVGPAVDKVDTVTPETTLDIATADEALWFKQDAGGIAVTAAIDVSGRDWVIAGVGGGSMFEIKLTATDTDTLGRARLYIYDTSLMLQIWEDFMVVPANVWDSMFGTDKLQVHAAEITAGLITAAAIGPDAITEAKIADDAFAAEHFATDAIDADAFAADGSVQIAAAVWDRVLTGGTHNIASSAGRRLRTLQDFGLYEGGAVWIDTINGTAGTTDFENGTVTNPVDSIADARTIADSVGLPSFRLLAGSSITLAQSYDGYEFRGVHYTVALNGQSVDDAHFEGGHITGNDSGSNPNGTHYVLCDINTSTLGLHTMEQCRQMGDLILSEAGDYFWDQCYSAVAGVGTPTVDFESAAETKNLSVRHHSGGLEFKNLGAGGGTHNASVEGNGQIILNANCAGGTIAIRGAFTVTDNAGGAVTLSDDARFDTAQINAEVVDVLNVDTWAELAQGAPPMPATFKEMVQYLYQCFRMKRTQSNTEIKMYDDAGTTVIAKNTISDAAGVFTYGEFGSGP